MRILYFLLITGMSLLVGCKKNGTDSPGSGEGAGGGQVGGSGGGQSGQTNGVYAAGDKYDATGNELAQIWKDGVATTLTNPNNFNFSCAYGVSVTNTDMYVVGGGGNASRYQGFIWKNGTPAVVGNGEQSSPSAIFTLGTDVYVAGSVYNGTIYVATLWKNGVATSLNSGTFGSVANAVYVSGSDVYVAGITYPLAVTGYLNVTERKATVWKNGVATTLSAGYFADANAVFVSGNDVYVAGTVYVNPKNFQGTGTGTAVVWKNGTLSQLDPSFLITDTYPSFPSEAHSICVSGTDVYVAGNLFKQGLDVSAMLWKNGIPTYLTDGTHKASAFAVVVSGSDVYEGGYVSKNVTANTVTQSPRIATIWKNGVASPLADGTTNSDVYAIFVK